MLNRIAVISLLLVNCAPVFAGPKEDALAAYQNPVTSNGYANNNGLFRNAHSDVETADPYR